MIETIFVRILPHFVNIYAYLSFCVLLQLNNNYWEMDAKATAHRQWLMTSWLIKPADNYLPALGLMGFMAPRWAMLHSDGASKSILLETLGGWVMECNILGCIGNWNMVLGVHMKMSSRGDKVEYLSPILITYINITYLHYCQINWHAYC